MKTKTVKIGIGGPVGSGKTALLDSLCKTMRKDYDLANQLFHEIPSSKRDLKSFKNIELLLARNESLEKFEEKKKEYNKRFSKRNAYSLYHSIWVYYKSNDCDKFNETLSKFEKIIGEEHSLKDFNRKCYKSI